MRNSSPFISAMDKAGIMPIFFHPDTKTCIKILESAYKGGIRVIEMVNRGKEAPGIFPELRKAADKMDGMSLGVGTIYHPEEADLFLDMGAEFIVAPVMNPKLGEHLQKLGIPWVPGCGTVSEVFFAKELGCELAKIYPANVLTSEFVKAVHAVLPDIDIIPTGGVEPTEEHIREWFGAGVLCLGMGSQLFKKELIANGDFKGIEETIRQALELIDQFKNKKGL